MAEEVKAPPKEKIPRQKMPEQEPEVRARNFQEVPLGYTQELAMKEAERCLQCKNPRCARAARWKSISRALSSASRKAIFRAPSASSGRRMPCPRSAAGSAPRKSSAKACASSAKRTHRSPSATWSASPPTTSGARQRHPAAQARAHREEGGRGRLRSLRPHRGRRPDPARP